MKLILKVALIAILFPIQLFGQTADFYTGSVTFPANFQVGDYVEFLQVAPVSANAGGYYEISIAYTRGNVAAAATHLASISHYNPALWREVGRINNNGYMSPGNATFTIDCNTQYGVPRFRVRAINNSGVATQDMFVYIKVRSVNVNTNWIPLNASGNDLTVTKFLPMTNDWNLYVGNPYTADGANLAIRAIDNGNVGIGTATPREKLSVNGRIRAQEVKVETANWPDYVFDPSHKLDGLAAVEKFIGKNGHLPGIPSAEVVEKDGIDLGDMNARLLKKIEELTLYLIQSSKDIDGMKARSDRQSKEIEDLRNELELFRKK
ncbi:hypothetical protein GS399_05270 [Pedobacter sp. HMF7647]|uniref:Uncharacterized protein n=1 Tax=Hufsiella arboris TaxID=2695275 RepID=A0A7K1Y730_9SPHI|nr:hypothetical protein [Hufsiella arboris]MXV50375.1 hypothetical protein [Hufsiella arboris]